MIPSMLVYDLYLPSHGARTFTLGMDVFPYNRSPGAPAGTLHWGAVPDGQWVGDL